MPLATTRVDPALVLTAVAALTLVAVVRAWTLPRGLWELDEVLFAAGVDHFRPLLHHPHPPGYPLLVGLGKLFRVAFTDSFSALVALSYSASLVGFIALFAAFRRILGTSRRRQALVAALLFHLSPGMLVHAPLPVSDPPALMFLSLALWAATVLADRGGIAAAVALGAAASAAVGCRPQLALAVLPMLVVALARVPGWRLRLWAATSFTAVCLAWLLPLVEATGGPAGFFDYQLGQAARVAAHDVMRTRAGRDPFAIALRFLANPWGPRWLGLAVIVLGAVGAAKLRRERGAAAAVLATLSGTHLVLCLTVLDPADAVRYALPATLGMALAATAGAERLAELSGRAAVAPATVGLMLLVGGGYAWPVLHARATAEAPPVQAARWARETLPRKSLLVVSEEMRAHGAYLFASFPQSQGPAGLDRAARRPRASAWLLAEGEPSWPGAVTFRWPASEAYRRLTRNHYRVVSLSPIPAQWRFVAGSGVRPLEPTLADGRWRWLERQAEVRLHSRGARRAAVTLGLPDSSPHPAREVRVSVEGAPAAHVQVAAGGSHTVQLELPRRRHGPLTIGFDAGSVPHLDSGQGGSPFAVQLLGIELMFGGPDG